MNFRLFHDVRKITLKWPCILLYIIRFKSFLCFIYCKLFSRIVPSNHRIYHFGGRCVRQCIIAYMCAYCKYLLNRFGDIYYPLELCDCLIYIHGSNIRKITLKETIQKEWWFANKGLSRKRQSICMQNIPTWHCTKKLKQFLRVPVWKLFRDYRVSVWKLFSYL